MELSVNMRKIISEYWWIPMYAFIMCLVSFVMRQFAPEEFTDGSLYPKDLNLYTLYYFVVVAIFIFVLIIGTLKIKDFQHSISYRLRRCYPNMRKIIWKLPAPLHIKIGLIFGLGINVDDVYLQKLFHLTYFVPCTSNKKQLYIDIHDYFQSYYIPNMIRLEDCPGEIWDIEFLSSLDCFEPEYQESFIRIHTIPSYLWNKEFLDNDLKAIGRDIQLTKIKVDQIKKQLNQ